MYALSLFMKYIELANFIFRLTFSFIPTSDKFYDIVYNQQGIIQEITYHLQDPIICISYIILSLCFIFTEIRNYVPINIRKPMHYIMFIFPLSYLILQFSKEVTKSALIGKYTYYSEKNGYILFGTMLFQNFVFDYVMLAVIVCLSYSSFDMKESVSTNDIIEQSLVI